MHSLLEIPPGVQCFFGREAKLRRELERRIVEVFRGWSYEEIVPPLFDYEEVFTRGGGPSSTENGPSIYRFIGRDGEVLALRPDFTALVAKVVVSRFPDRPLPLRLFYSGEVLRHRPPRAGQQEELFQVGLEHLGDGVAADLEVLLIAIEALETLEVETPLVTIGHAGLVMGLLEEVSSELGTETSEAALSAFKLRDPAALAESLGTHHAERISAVLDLSGGPEILEPAGRLVGSDQSRIALERLQTLAHTLDGLGLGERYQLDLGALRGFDYYTGMVFEIHAAGGGRSGVELGGGGRYDSLLSRFGKDLPAIGFYLSLDRLAEILTPRMAEGPTSAAAIPVGSPEDSSTQALGAAFSRALGCRRRGETVRLDTAPR